MKCVCDFDSGYDSPSVCTEKIVVARRDHVCCECGETIKKGEKYERVKGLWDGDWDTYCTCIICSKIRDDYCSTWVYGELWEQMRYCFGDEVGP
jgi:hypothetical protein